MNKACIFFKISDLAMHYPRNYKRYPDITQIKNYVYDEKYGNYTKADLFFPKNAKEKLPVIVNVHGGGFVKGDKRHRKSISAEFARLGYFVYNVNYRRSPEYPMPTASVDVVNSLYALPSLAEKYNLDLTEVVVTGDSAGGFYSAAAVCALTNPEYAKLLGVTPPEIVPTAFMGFCGAYKLGDLLEQKSPMNVARDIGAALMGVKCGEPLDLDKCERAIYTDVTPYVTEKFPRTFLLYSKIDAFCGGQTEKLIDALNKNNVPVTELYAQGEKDIHCFHLLPHHKTTPSVMKAVKQFLLNK